MSFKLPIVRMATEFAKKQVSAVIPKPTSINLISVPKVVSPSMVGTPQYNANYNRALSLDIYELCAVPKKRTSVTRKRVRAEGRWNKEASRVYKPYKICLECMRPMLPKTVCTSNKRCMDMPRV